MSRKQPTKEQVDSVPKSNPRQIDSLTRRPIKKSSDEDNENDENLSSHSSDSESSNNFSGDCKESMKDQKNEIRETKYNEYNKNHKGSELSVFHYFIQFFNSNKYTCVGVFTVCILLYLLWNSQDELKAKDTLSQIFKDMENHFSHQPHLTLRQVKKQLMKVYNTTNEPPAPAIIILIPNRGAESNASDFCLYLGTTLPPRKYILINNSSDWNGEPDDLKLKIDNEVKYNYHKDQVNVIIIEKLQNIPFEAAMIFHSYCDHENSPFKKAVFLFILHVNEVIPENTSIKHLDSLAMYSLRKVWFKATDDEVDSLITRLTGTVVNIK